MKKFLRLLLICSSGLLLLVSCSPVPTKGYSRQAVSDQRFTPVFNNAFQKALYKVEISYGSRNISGVAIIKKMEENRTLRTVFMSETGLKYFDFEYFQNDSTVVHYMMDAMNRKKIIRTLTTDLGLILKRNLDHKLLTYFSSENPSDGLVIKEKQKGRNYFFSEEHGNQPSKICHRASFAPSTNIEINYNPERIPSKIVFRHGIINFKMELKLITE
jgi:hypothetical protein